MANLIILVDGTVPVAADFNTNFAALNNAIGAATTIAAYTTGDLTYASATNTLGRLPIGLAGQALTVVGGVPAWVTGVKGWVYFDSNGNILISHNVTSVTDNGVGDFTVNWTIPFSSVHYAAIVTVRADYGGTDASTYTAAPTESGTTASATRVLTARVSDGALIDPNHISVVVLGG